MKGGASTNATVATAEDEEQVRSVTVLLVDGTSVAFNGMFVNAQRWWAPGMPPHGPR
jgi:hypothetical protein